MPRGSKVTEVPELGAGPVGWVTGGGVGGAGTLTGIAIVTLRFKARPAGLSAPVVVLFGAIGSAEPRPALM